jgi:hypothetical protein
MADQLGLDQYDRICYLYDYGEECRFYAILKEVRDDEADDTAPEVVNEKGDDLDQYDSSVPADAASGSSTLPEPLESFPDTAILVMDLRALEDRDDVAQVVVLLSIETGFGAVSERFIIRGAGAIPRPSGRGYAPSPSDALHRYRQGWIFHAKHRI